MIDPKMAEAKSLLASAICTARSEGSAAAAEVEALIDRADTLRAESHPQDHPYWGLHWEGQCTLALVLAGAVGESDARAVLARIQAAPAKGFCRPARTKLLASLEAALAPRQADIHDRMLAVVERLERLADRLEAASR